MRTSTAKRDAGRLRALVGGPAKRAGAVPAVKDRMNVYLDPALVTRCKVYVAQHGGNLSALTADALTAYLDARK